MAMIKGYRGGETERGFYTVILLCKISKMDTESDNS